MTPNVITQTSTKVAMASRFLGLVGSLSLEEQRLWFPNQVVHDPDTWTAPHLLHLKREYQVLVRMSRGGNVHGARPTDSDSIQKSNNHRMLQQLSFHVENNIPGTSIQDLNPRPCADNDQSSVLSFEMTVIEPGNGKISTCTLT